MSLSQRVVAIINNQGRSKKWVAEQCGINYKTFVDRLLNDRLTAYDLIHLSEILDFSLDEFRRNLK
jgi:hypothetical protein